MDAGAPPAVIRCKTLGKQYFLRTNDANPVRRILHRARSRRAETHVHQALQGVNLEIRAGESVALIGRNGSGKSTLLKMITGITRPTEGHLEVNGRVGGILDLTAGFHPDLTGYENIFLQGTLLGLSRAEIRARLNQIEDFSELGRFLNSPVRHYSSGMFLRLAFSIAVHTDPDIFIIDEALAVGDGYFMWKCMECLKEMKANGKTLLYVSHVPEQVESLCERAIWIDHGRVRADGEITVVVQDYHRMQFAALLAGEPRAYQHELSALISYSRFGTGDVVMQNVELCNQEGRPARFFEQGSTLVIRLNARAKAAMDRVSLYFILERPNQSVTFIDSMERDYVFALQPGDNSLEMRLPDLPLMPGPYIVTMAVGHADDRHLVYDAHQKIYSFTITPAGDQKTRYSHGLMHIPCTIAQSIP